MSKIFSGKTLLRLEAQCYVSQRMAVNKLVSIKSVIKGHHVYRVSYTCGTKLDCFLEPENQHSDSAIIVKKEGTTVGHINSP